MVGGAVGEQGVQAVRLVGAVGIHGQLLPERFLFPAVGKPVVDANLGDQVGAQAVGFGGGDASLQTFRPENGEGGDGERGWPGEAGSAWPQTHNPNGFGEEQKPGENLSREKVAHVVLC